MKVEEFTQLVVIFVAFQTYGILASYINIICSHQTLFVKFPQVIYIQS